MIRKLLLVIPTLFALVTVVIGVVACGKGAASSSASVEAYTPQSLPVLYRLSPEDESTIRKVVLSDPRVKELIKGHEYAISVAGHEVKGSDWDISVGAVLREGASPDEVNRWLEGGRKDKAIIAEVVAVLSVGYNDTYLISVDMEKGSIGQITHQRRMGLPIPELTAKDRQRAVEIALKTPLLQELLEDKKYVVAPEGTIGVWHTTKDHRKIGAALEVWFDNFYDVEADLPWPDYDEEKYTSFPYYQEQSSHWSGKVKALVVLVDLNKKKVVGITARPVDEGTKDLYQQQ